MQPRFLYFLAGVYLTYIMGLKPQVTQDLFLNTVLSVKYFFYASSMFFVRVFEFFTV